MLVGLPEDYLIVSGIGWGTVILAMVIFASLRPWKAHTRIVRILARLFLAVWTLIVLLASLETGFALLYDTTDSFSLTNVSRRWYERHVRYNNMGYRDDKSFQLTVPKGEKRIMIIGDSFTFGHGIADIANRFSDVLENRCHQELGANWEIDNFALPALATSSQLSLLRELGERGLQADLCLLVYCLNDIEDLVPDSRIIVGTIILDLPSHWLFRRTYFPNFLYYRYRQFSRPEVRGYFEWLAEAYRGPVWNEQVKQLDELRHWCSDSETPLLVALFPFLTNLGPEYPFEEAHRKLRDYFARHQVPCLDLLETFRAHRNERLVVNRFDAHPNERAHALAAEAIWDNLLEDRLRQVTPEPKRTR